MNQHEPLPWTSRIDPDYTAAFGVGELHGVLFEPDDDRGGMRDTIAVQIPEASRQCVRRACRLATQLRARVSFICDTVEQAEQTAGRVARWLPHHHRISLERAREGGWGAQAS